MSEKKIKRALISVSDKTGIEELARELHALGIEIISTGGTLRQVKEAGVPAVSVSAFTGCPEMLDGRVKTLHPKVHAGILYRRDEESHVEQMSSSDYKQIDLVVVNLYPFQQTVARADASHEEIIENIDIGGPGMIRSSAKNYESVTVVVDPLDYSRLITELKDNNGATTPDFRYGCAAKAYGMTATYDKAISEYFACHAEQSPTEQKPQLTLNYTLKSKLRYGENPHQTASVHSRDSFVGPSLVNAEVLSGKELSYNNYGDLDAGLEMVLDFDEPFTVLLKHANPCGAAVGSTITEAYRAAYDSDPLSAFGCIIALNREVDMDCAKVIHETPFVECVLAPGYSEEAFKLLKKKKARRLLSLDAIPKGRVAGQDMYKFIQGGLLVQSVDELFRPQSEWKVVTERQPTKEELKSLWFAWKVVKHTKSNAIVLAKGNATVGVGMGQTSRVDSGFMAVKRAGARSKGAVMASDAFFPMPDGLEVGTDAGVTAVVQPGGSKGDEAVIEAANKAGVTMLFTGERHFKH
ncbi:MAG: bifunctional phosphoribosylaminoimidazolecarboxamide formyltransferase/IMP cyclohydrolase [bacterium]|nr:bifunctional phosphoribosylaminoimidazolecarboxamide formyltransferase/IMP cyclohydrolase [bacterium]